MNIFYYIARNSNVSASVCPVSFVMNNLFCQMYPSLWFGGAKNLSSHQADLPHREVAEMKIERR